MFLNFSRIAPGLNSNDCANDKRDNGVPEPGNKAKSLQLNLDLDCDRLYTPRLYCLSQHDISEDLAKIHPEFTIAMLSGTAPTSALTVLSNLPNAT